MRPSTSTIESTDHGQPVDQIADFLELLHPAGQVFEIRAPKYDRGRTLSGYFDDPRAAAEAVVAAGIDGKASIYVTLNPCIPALLARASRRLNREAKATTGDNDISWRNWLLVDIDPKRPADISASDEEAERAHAAADEIRDYLTGLGWPAPIETMSGNGRGLLYPISRPNNPDSEALVKGVLAHLAGRFNDEHISVDQTVSNASRITALIGTMKVKGDDTPERPHRRSRLVAAPDERRAVEPELLAQLAGEPPAKATGTITKMGAARPLGSALDEAGIAHRLGRYADGWQWYDLEDCPWHPGEDPFKCGVAQHDDGRYGKHCFHDRGADKPWAAWRSALGLTLSSSKQSSGAERTSRDQRDRDEEQERERIRPTGDLADALEATVKHLRRFVYLPRAEQYDAIALWCAHTHAIDQCEFSPILNVTSAVWRSGKSRVLEAIEHVVARGWKVIQPSEPVLFREVDARQPTLLLDEADTTFNKQATKRGENEPTRAILNAGNRRGTSIPRMVPSGRGFERQDFRIYCAKAIAGIGELPATVVDRSITIVMERKTAEDKVERLRLRDIEATSLPIHDALEHHLASVSDLVVEQSVLPDELDDRAQDGWEPLLAIAALAGGDWPTRARTAAIALSAGRADHADEDMGLVLLIDCFEAFYGYKRGADKPRDAAAPPPHLTSSQLVERLCLIPESAWSTWRQGDKSITTRGVAVMLKRFGVAPHRDKVGSLYRLDDFAKVWARYAPTSATSATSATEGEDDPAPEHESAPSEAVALGGSQVPPQVPPPDEGLFPHESAPVMAPVADVALVADVPGVRPPCFADAALYRAHASAHYNASSAAPRCRACEQGAAA